MLLRTKDQESAIARAAQIAFEGVQDVISEAAYELTLEAQMCETLEQADNLMREFCGAPARVNKETRSRMTENKLFAERIQKAAQTATKMPAVHYFADFLGNMERLSAQQGLTKLKATVNAIQLHWTDMVARKDLDRDIAAHTDKVMARKHPAVYALLQELSGNLEDYKKAGAAPVARPS